MTIEALSEPRRYLELIIKFPVEDSTPFIKIKKLFKLHDSDSFL